MGRIALLATAVALLFPTTAGATKGAWNRVLPGERVVTSCGHKCRITGVLVKGGPAIVRMTPLHASVRNPNERAIGVRFTYRYH